MESKPYVVLARKYRPQTFDDVIGQEAIGTTLKNAITLKRVGHAYLFTGPRGVGKTSMARIFAKALNCKKGPTVTPCGECPACAEIEGARSLDVLEIDGASNRGIDEIRALRENVKFAPAAGNFKIYIIDEVHQITTDGFNALLKTLEEPPAHVKFIFATTSANKVPATILSRCQRFDFRRITTDTIASTLKEICKKEKIKIDEDALFLVAKAADGSLRDSQSLLDQIAACADGKISKQDVLGSLGSLEEEKLVELTTALAEGDAKAALFLLNDVLNEGKDAFIFLEKFLEHTRNLLFMQVSEKLGELIDAPESYKKALAEQAKKLSKDELFYFSAVITHTLQTMKRFEAKRIPLEIALVKLARKAPMEELSQVLEALKNQEKKSPNLRVEPVKAAPAPAAKISTPVKHHQPALKEEDDSDEEDLDMIDDLPPTAIPAKESAFHEMKNVSLATIWSPLIGALKSEKISVASYLAEGEPIGVSAGVARISFPEQLEFHRETLEAPDNRRLIEKHLSLLLNQTVRIEFESVKQLSGKKTEINSVLESSAKPAANAPPDEATDSMIKSAMNMFGGRILGQ